MFLSVLNASVGYPPSVLSVRYVFLCVFREFRDPFYCAFEFLLSRWVIFHLPYPAFLFVFGEFRLVFSLRFAIFALHHLPANLSYQFDVRSLSFSYVPAVTVCFFKWNPYVMGSRWIPSYSRAVVMLFFSCISSQFRALRSPYITRYGAPALHHEFAVESLPVCPLAFPLVSFRYLVSFVHCTMTSRTTNKG